jgi:hypothetical protein
VNPPRLAILIGTHRHAQALVPVLQQSRFALTHHCLEATQFYQVVEAGMVDVALVSTGPRGLEPSALASLARRRVPLVALDSHPHHQRWAGFAGVVLAADASPDLVLTGLEAALRGEHLRQPVDRAEDRSSSIDRDLVDEDDSPSTYPRRLKPWERSSAS